MRWAEGRPVCLVSLTEEGHVYADGISLTWLPLASALNITPRASESGSVTAELAQRHGFHERGLQKWNARNGETSETLGFGRTVAPTHTFQPETDMWPELGCSRPKNKQFHHLSKQVTVTQFDCTGLWWGSQIPGFSTSPSARSLFKPRSNYHEEQSGGFVSFVVKLFLWMKPDKAFKWRKHFKTALSKHCGENSFNV